MSHISPMFNFVPVNPENLTAVKKEKKRRKKKRKEKEKTHCIELTKNITKQCDQVYSSSNYFDKFYCMCLIKAGESHQVICW